MGGVEVTDLVRAEMEEVEAMVQGMEVAQCHCERREY